MMHYALAALSPEEGQWLVTGLAVVAFLVGIGVGLKVLFKPPTGEPQPFLIRLEEEFVKKKEFEALKSDVHNQLSETRSYLHEGIHGLKNDLNTVGMMMQAGQQEMRGDIDGVKEQIIDAFQKLDEKRSRSTGNLHEHLTLTKERIAASESTVKAINQTMHGMDAKIDALRRDLTQPAAAPRRGS